MVIMTVLSESYSSINNNKFNASTHPKFPKVVRCHGLWLPCFGLFFFFSPSFFEDFDRTPVFAVYGLICYFLLLSFIEVIQVFNSYCICLEINI